MRDDDESLRDVFTYTGHLGTLLDWSRLMRDDDESLRDVFTYTGHQGALLAHM
jgi:hypothetical protein